MPVVCGDLPAVWYYAVQPWHPCQVRLRGGQRQNLLFLQPVQSQECFNVQTDYMKKIAAFIELLFGTSAVLYALGGAGQTLPRNSAIIIMCIGIGFISMGISQLYRLFKHKWKN